MTVMPRMGLPGAAARGSGGEMAGAPPGCRPPLGHGVPATGEDAVRCKPFDAGVVTGVCERHVF